MPLAHSTQFADRPVLGLGLRRRFQTAIGLLIAVVVVSTIGFRLIQGESGGWSLALWETLNLISTVGSLDPLSDAERSWAMLVIVFGMGAAVYGFGSLTAMLTSGEILFVYEGRKMQRKIDALTNHVILCGFGTTGRVIAERLREFEVDLVLIDRDPKAVGDALEAGFLAIEDDCTHEESLERAGIARARVVVSVLSSDAENVFVVLTAKGMAPGLHIVARASEPATLKKLERAGADHVTMPNQIAAYQMADLAVRPEVGSFISRVLGGDEIELIELAIADHPWMSGRSIRDLNLTRRADVIVVSILSAVDDSARVFNPSPDTVVTELDKLLVVARSGARERLVGLGDAAGRA